MSDTTTPGTDPPPDAAEAHQPNMPDDPPIYDVTGAPDDQPDLAGALLPRRDGHGRRGVLVADRPAGLVHLLDADDTAGTFRHRETRQLAGDPADLDPPRDGSDHIVRAAIEDVYDVIAAPWAGADQDDRPRRRGRRAGDA